MQDKGMGNGGRVHVKDALPLLFKGGRDTTVAPTPSDSTHTTVTGRTVRRRVVVPTISNSKREEKRKGRYENDMQLIK